MIDFTRLLHSLGKPGECWVTLKSAVAGLLEREVPTLPVMRLTGTATVPTRGTPGAIGLDLYADLPFMPQGLTIPAGQREIIRTGIAIAVPDGYYAQIAGRSGLAYKKGVAILGGVIDDDYRGDVGVIMLNTGAHDLVVEHGDRIAQLILIRAAKATPQEVKTLPATSRGAGGFGSTGG